VVVELCILLRILVIVLNRARSKRDPTDRWLLLNWDFQKCRLFVSKFIGKATMQSQKDTAVLTGTVFTQSSSRK
jgi:hypothetical protein